MSRSRSRSRSRRRHRAYSGQDYRSRSPTLRPRSLSPRLSRSTSRELLRGIESPTGKLQKIVEKQQDYIVELLADHRAELEDKFQSRARKFSSRPIEKQFQVNCGFKDTAVKIQLALDSGEVQRAKDQVDSLQRQLEEHEENLVIADSSPHGWLAVSKLRTHRELPKALRKKLSQVERELDGTRSRQRFSGPRRQFGQFSRQGAEVATRRTTRRISPEEALAAASKQLRPGVCVHCNKSLHYYKECPEFWAQVQKSREAQIKGSDTTNN